jgi:hypothetical protein
LFYIVLKTVAIQSLFFYIWPVNWRWYIPICLIVLAYFGISEERSTLPNQEIIVRFDGSSVGLVEARQAISEVTEKLKTIGIRQIQVSDLQNGRLKVSYYSRLDVSQVRQLFQSHGGLHVADFAKHKNPVPFQAPFGNESGSYYKLDIVKIDEDLGSNMGLHGFPVEIKSIKDYNFIPVISLAASHTEFLGSEFENVSPKNYGDLSLLRTLSPHYIPEVRAGPTS